MIPAQKPHVRRRVGGDAAPCSAGMEVGYFGGWGAALGPDAAAPVPLPDRVALVCGESHGSASGVISVFFSSPLTGRTRQQGNGSVRTHCLALPSPRPWTRHALPYVSTEVGRLPCHALQGALEGMPCSCLAAGFTITQVRGELVKDAEQRGPPSSRPTQPLLLCAQRPVRR